MAGAQSPSQRVDGAVNRLACGFKMMTIASCLQTLVAVALFAFAIGAHAQDYPTKPIRLIVPYPPGGATDALVRPIAQSLTQKLGTQFIVDNRGGGATLIGA